MRLYLASVTRRRSEHVWRAGCCCCCRGRGGLPVNEFHDGAPVGDGENCVAAADDLGFRV